MWHECSIEKNFYRSVCDECFCNWAQRSAAESQQWVCFALIGAHFISDEGSTNPLLSVYFNTGGIFGSQNLQAKYAVTE